MRYAGYLASHSVLAPRATPGEIPTSVVAYLMESINSSHIRNVMCVPLWAVVPVTDSNPPTPASSSVTANLDQPAAIWQSTAVWS